MAYTPTPAERRRLERAVELARFSEGERIAWLCSFVLLMVLIAIQVAGGGTWVGALGCLGGLALLYWRLRGGHVAGRVKGDRGLFGPNLASREQRAFTGIMLRYVLTGRNPLEVKPEHDPFARWAQGGERAPAAEEG